jgi:methyl-accepting chemotaxis protein
MGRFIANLRIRDRLIIGFAAVCLVLVGAVGATIWKVDGNNALTQRMVQLRVPTAMTGGDLVARLYGSPPCAAGC